MIRQGQCQSPIYQRLPFSHNQQQPQRDTPIAQNLRPSTKPSGQKLSVTNQRGQQSMEKLKQQNSPITFLKPQNDLTNPNSRSQGKHQHNGSVRVDSITERRTPTHNNIFQIGYMLSPVQQGGKLKTTIQIFLVLNTSNQKKVASMGSEDHFRFTQFTPNSRLKETLTKTNLPFESISSQQFTKQQIQNNQSSGNLTGLVKPYSLTQYGFQNEYTSLQQSASQKRHNPTGSVNFNQIQQQLNQLNRKADTVLQQRTPQKFSLQTEHNKSKSVAETKENEFFQSNVQIKSPQNMINKFIMAQSSQIQSPIISESLGSQEYTMCVIHQGKRGKYFNDQDGQYYCSRCAVQMATQGVKLLDLSTTSQSQSGILPIQIQAQQVQSKIINQGSLDPYTYKEMELKSFLNTLMRDNQFRCQLPQILTSQMEQVMQWYEGQIQQCDQYHNTLKLSLEEEYKLSIQSLHSRLRQNINELQQWIKIITEQQQDAIQIQKDITDNFQQVIEGIQIDSFKSIMSQYQQRFKAVQQTSDIILSQQITMVSLPPTDLPQLQRAITDSFQLIESTIPMIPTQLAPNVQYLNTNPTIQQQSNNFNQKFDEPYFGQPLKTQPTPPKSQEHTPIRTKTEQSYNIDNQQGLPQTNFFQYFFEKHPTQIEQQMFESTESCKALASESIHNRNPIYVSFENREIFCTAALNENLKTQQSQKLETIEEKPSSIMVLHSYHGSQQIEPKEQDSPHSTPHSPASGQTKTQYERVTTTQQVKQSLQQNEITQNAFQKSKQTFRTLFDTLPDDEPMHDNPTKSEQKSQKQKIERSPQQQIQSESVKVSPATSDKFKSFLNRVSHNQSKTQLYYQTFMQNQHQQTIISPKRYINNSQNIQDAQLSEFENDDDKEVQEVFSSQQMNNQNRLSSQKVMHSSQKKQRSNAKRELSVPSDSSGESERQSKSRDPYQKTLFCSPTFKNDCIDLNVSQSSQE